MKVKNNYKSHLGFGTARILPGETAELPKGYGENHPVVKFYLSKGWLTPVVPATALEAPVNTEQEQKAAELAAKIKALSNMNLDPLRALATELNIAFETADTKAVLVQKITDAYQKG